MDDSKKKLNEIRNSINEIDKEMANLFEKRMNCAKEVAIYKQKYALPIMDKKRENELIEKNSSLIESDEVREYYVNYLQEMMDISKRYQTRIIDGMKIAYSGVKGAFAYIACKKMFEGATYVSYPSFEKAYQAVCDGICDSCVLPIENSFAGDVGQVMDLVFSGPLFINQIIDLDIIHNLIVKKGTKKEDIKVVWSHPQALAQCSDYIEENGFVTEEYPNTAVASLALSKSDLSNVGVVASSDTAELYGLEILETNINSSKNNTTRFATFSRVLNKERKNGKMGNNFILVYTVLNEAGSLAKTLNIIGAHGFNMRNLRSRPMKKLLWNYYFFVECEGDIYTSDGQDMLNELKTICDCLKLVGSYNSYLDK